jgi:hypothetical protein
MASILSAASGVAGAEKNANIVAGEANGMYNTEKAQRRETTRRASSTSSLNRSKGRARPGRRPTMRSGLPTT